MVSIGELKRAENGENQVRRLAYFYDMLKVYVVKMDFRVIDDNHIKEVVENNLHPAKVMRISDLNQMIEDSREPSSQELKEFTPDSLVDDMIQRLNGLRIDEESIDAFFGSARHVIDSNLLLGSYQINKEIKKYPLSKMVKFEPEKLEKTFKSSTFPNLMIADLIVKPAIYCSFSK